ncbi:MAG TPA: hypothetical protein VF234_04780, partial [Limnochordia bacterium]
MSVGLSRRSDGVCPSVQIITIRDGSVNRFIQGPIDFVAKMLPPDAKPSKKRPVKPDAPQGS